MASFEPLHGDHDQCLWCDRDRLDGAHQQQECFAKCARVKLNSRLARIDGSLGAAAYDHLSHHHGDSVAGIVATDTIIVVEEQSSGGVEP